MNTSEAYYNDDDGFDANSVYQAVKSTIGNMTTSETYYDDDGFDADYVNQVKSVNPGWPLLAFTIAYGLAVVYFIPTFIFLEGRNEWYKKFKTKVRRARKNLQERRERAAAETPNDATPYTLQSEDEAKEEQGGTTSTSPGDITPYTLEAETDAKEEQGAERSRKVVIKGLKKKSPKTKSGLVATDDASVDSYSSVAKTFFLGIDEGHGSILITHDEGRKKAHMKTRSDQTNGGLPIICEDISISSSSISSGSGRAVVTAHVEPPSEQVYVNAESCNDTTSKVDDSSPQIEEAPVNKNPAKQTLSFYEVFDERVTLWDMARPDENMAQINKTAAPWILQRISNDVHKIIVVALLSQFVGNDAMLAYVAVELVLGIFSSLSAGIYSASYRHASIAVNAGDNFLAGQYCRISIFYTFLAGIPTVAFAILFMDEVLALLGFSAHVVDIAHSYSFVWAISNIVESFDESWSVLLDICDDGGKFGAILDFYLDAIELLISILAIAVFNVNSLFLVSVMWLAGVVFFTWRKMIIVHRSGKLCQFYSGLRSNAMANTDAVKVITKACIPAIAQCFLFDVEWRLFALMASFIGPAEAASWILLEKVWMLSEIVVDNFSEAAAPIISGFLVTGEVVLARVLAYKSLFVGALYGAFSSCILVVLGPLIVTFMTTDSTIQTLLR